MPGGVAHKINDHVDQVPDSAGPSFSTEQFEELVRLLTPIHGLALKVLEQMTEVAELAPPQEKPAPDDTDSRSDSERGSG